MLSMFQTKPDLIVHSKDPLNAEPPLAHLRENFITPQKFFYVRSHGNIPKLDPARHRLSVTGMVTTPLDLSMDELRTRFSKRQVTAVLQCAGNRRADMQQVKPVSGDPWAPGAIGNAEWGGVAFADVLRAAGADETRTLHVAFAALDDIDIEGEQFRFGASLPMAKALSSDVLLAFEMNGDALLPEHGFPLRVITPGYAGVRSPKWLASISVQDMPSDNHIQQRDYRLVPPHITKDTVDWSKGMTINDMPLNSAICEPAAHATLKAGKTMARGYAIATERRVVRVDVSINDGRNWSQAELEPDSDAPWSWVFWQAELDLPAGEHELAVRAWDSAGQTQPVRPDDTWNFKGYLSAAWHRVPVTVS
ncbi:MULTISPECIES: molybdopterin-dependent oxidoreductase [Acidiphilium]|uniref:Sulfite oxidase n=1 Tax=Acidiphilium rubrum TaxID=526 RepID=A0A8G2CP40_ACIRU|nr:MULTISPECIES: molybdopterin-dependent oxidoreductase [Acidiphilium]SIR55305.1 sulfite oxidase [Acidiphilium rubrum]